MDDLTPLEDDEVVKPSNKRRKVKIKKSALNEQFTKRREEKKKKKGPQTDIRVNVVNLFYKRFIHEEENYTVDKQERLYFRLEEINTFYKLDDNVAGQIICKNPTRKDIRDALKMIVWP